VELQQELEDHKILEDNGIITNGGTMPNKNIDNPVAVYSTSNLFKSGLGTLKKGYNIISKEASEYWTNHKAVRLATPEELVQYYGINK
jgi:hypothetical protein